MLLVFFWQCYVNVFVQELKRSSSLRLVCRLLSYGSSTFIIIPLLTFSYHPHLLTGRQGIDDLRYTNADIYLDSFWNSVAKKMYIAAGILLDIMHWLLTIVCCSKRRSCLWRYCTNELWLRALLALEIGRYLLHSWTANWSPCPWSWVTLILQRRLIPLFLSEAQGEYENEVTPKLKLTVMNLKDGRFVLSESPQPSNDLERSPECPFTLLLWDTWLQILPRGDSRKAFSYS